MVSSMLCKECVVTITIWLLSASRYNPSEWWQSETQIKSPVFCDITLCSLADRYLSKKLHGKPHQKTKTQNVCI